MYDYFFNLAAPKKLTVSKILTETCPRGKEKTRTVSSSLGLTKSPSKRSRTVIYLKLF